MCKENNICSKTETIGVHEMRELMKTANLFKNGLSFREYYKIMIIFGDCGDRILKENGEE